MSFKAIRYPLICLKHYKMPFEKVIEVRRHYMLDRPVEEDCVVANHYKFKPRYMKHHNFTKLLLMPYTHEHQVLLIKMYEEYRYVGTLLDRPNEFLFLNSEIDRFGHTLNIVTPFNIYEACKEIIGIDNGTKVAITNS